MILHIGQGLGAAPAVLALGFGRGNASIGGCPLLVDPMLGITGMFVLSGAGHGNGSHAHTLSLPAFLPPMAITSQAFSLDAGAPNGFSTSHGAELVVF